MADRFIMPFYIVNTEIVCTKNVRPLSFAALQYLQNIYITVVSFEVSLSNPSQWISFNHFGQDDQCTFIQFLYLSFSFFYLARCLFCPSKIQNLADYSHWTFYCRLLEANVNKAGKRADVALLGIPII